MTRLTLALLVALTTPAMAKDKSRVLQTGPDEWQETITRVCHIKRVKFDRKPRERMTVITRQTSCTFHSGFVVMISTNIIREMAIARSFGCKPFRLEQCNG
jgi:hypothetical protein